MIKLKTTVFIFLLTACILANAQDGKKFTLSGVLVDSISNQPIEYASVAIYQSSDTSLVTGVITNNKGEFVATGLKNGDYLVSFSFVGYKTKTIPAVINNSAYRFSKPVQFAVSSLSLNEVVVSSTGVEKQVSIEKTKINVSQNMSSVSGSITEVLKSLPSVSLDADENLYLRGSGNVLILVDGRPTTVTTLSSFPASQVESIEIITNPDAKYDSEGTGGILNIITKKKKQGFSSAVTLNYGFMNRINGGLNVNLGKGFWELNFGYNGRYEETGIESNLTREYLTQSLKIEQNIQSRQVNSSHLATLNFSANLNKKNILSVGLKTLFPDAENAQEINGKQTNWNIPDEIYFRKNEVTWGRKAFEGSLSYRKIIEKGKNEISVDASFSRTKGSRTGDYYPENEYLQKSDAGGRPTNTAIQTDYFKQVSNAGKVETGLKAFSRWNSFSSQFWDKDTLSGDWVINASLSSDLVHDEFIYSAYLMYSDSVLRKFFYKIGGRVEYNTSNLDLGNEYEVVRHEFLFPFPFFLLKYNIDKQQSLALSFNRRVTRPVYMQLNPYIVVIDPLTYETGNQLLIPEISDKIEINHSWINEKFQVRSNFYFSTTKDFITQISRLLPPDTIIITYANGDKLNKLGLETDANFKINKSVSLNPGFSVFKSHSTGLVDNIDLSTNNVAFTANLKATIKPEARTEMQMLVSYNSPIALPQFDLDEIYYADVSVKRMFLKNKLTISLSLTDIFNTRNWILTSDNAAFSLTNDSKKDTRIFWIGLTWHLNAYKSSKPAKGEPQEEEGLIKLGQ